VITVKKQLINARWSTDSISPRDESDATAQIAQTSASIKCAMHSIGLVAVLRVSRIFGADSVRGRLKLFHLYVVLTFRSALAGLTSLR